VLGAALIASAGAHAVRDSALLDPTTSTVTTTRAVVAAAPPVLAPAKAEGVTPTAAGVQRVLAPLLADPSMGRHRGAFVYDVSRDRPVFSSGAAQPFVPASTLKLLTTASALAALGPHHRFATRTVRAGRNSIVLVGGGDPLLTAKRPDGASTFPARATLQDLATRTAQALRAEGVRSVSLGYDAGLFSGPAVNPRWLPLYVGEGIAAPTTALWVDEGRVVRGLARRSPSPALAAATVFARQLRAAGLTVAVPGPAKAPAGAPSLAQVLSAPLGQLVEHVNLTSDNDGAEVLLRHVGLATGNGGSITAGLKGMRSTLTGLGLDLGAARLEDGSGLSRTNQVPLQVLGGVVRIAAAGDKPQLRHLLTGLPVAGFNGSLAERFAAPGTAAGTGFVRAKTGTLTGIHSLAGLVRDRTGTVLAFAVATDSSPTAKTLTTRATLDRIAAALAGCGCG
jgi:D-alanyl-D-alanine carboxypeptidase/D-alanyl-D-alanine-endopeptidase (penicillin-binding protein 4)